MKNWKRFTALGLTAVMLCGMLVGCGNSKDVDSSKTKQTAEQESAGQQTEESQETVNELAWLNSSQTLPLVEEGTEKTLRIYVNMPTDSPEPEDTWFYKFIENAMNINLEVTKFTDDISVLFSGINWCQGERIMRILMQKGFENMGFIKTKEFFVGIDSDGTAFDLGMRKQKRLL